MSIRSILNSRRRQLHNQRGVAMVEFALVLPILLIVLFGIFDFGRAINYWIDATHLANETARYAAVGNKPTTCSGSLVSCMRAQADSGEPGERQQLGHATPPCSRQRPQRHHGRHPDHGDRVLSVPVVLVPGPAVTTTT